MRERVHPRIALVRKDRAASRADLLRRLARMRPEELQRWADRRMARATTDELLEMAARCFRPDHFGSGNRRARR